MALDWDRIVSQTEDDTVYVENDEILAINPYVPEDVMLETIRVNYGYPEYEGVYDVTPSETAQILRTRETSMEADITVQAIPFAEVSNPAGGYTATIG